MRSGCLRVPDLFYALSAAPMCDVVPSLHCRARAGPPNLRVPHPHQTARRLIIVVLILKPLISRVVDRTTNFSMSGLSVKFNEDLDSIGPALQLDREEIKTLVEGPKEQLEKLRIYLETEQIKQLIGYHQNGVYQSKISF